jgi:signal transduction histidine kinase
MTDPALCSIALLCDAEWRVQRVLHNPRNFPAVPGAPLAELFDPSSREKALRFAQTVSDRQAAFGWELYVRERDRSVLMHFSGAKVAEGVLIAGAADRTGANTLFSSWMKSEGVDAPRLEAESIQSAPELYEQLAALNNQLVAMQRELEKKNATLTRLFEDRARIAAMAAHDLRTPLQVIQTSATLLGQFVGTPPGAESGPTREIDTILRNADKMIVLVNDLLVAYSSDIDNLELALRPLDLAALVQANAENNRAMAQQKRISLSFRASADVPRVLGDPMRLDQMLSNLVHNAIKFSPEASEIRLGVCAARGDAMIEVEDRGIGIDQERLETLLHGSARDSRPGTRSEPGFGLGFAIIRTIVRKHGGSIEGASRPGGGTRIVIRLPACREPGL